jgi:hypothetical protein
MYDCADVCSDEQNRERGQALKNTMTSVLQDGFSGIYSGYSE